MSPVAVLFAFRFSMVTREMTPLYSAETESASSTAPSPRIVKFNGVSSPSSYSTSYCSRLRRRKTSQRRRSRPSSFPRCLFCGSKGFRNYVVMMARSLVQEDGRALLLYVPQDSGGRRRLA